MKTTHIAVLSRLLAFKRVFASLEQMKQIMTELSNEEQEKRPGERYLVDAFSQLNFFGDGYGCHCHFWENALKGQGKPVDTTDERCRVLSRGYDCIKLDAQRKGVTDCQEPWFVAFRSQGFGTWDENNLESECVKLNPDSWCAQKVCQVEAPFILDIFVHFRGQEIFMQDEYRSSNGFDFDTSCHKTTSQHEESESSLYFQRIECCGEYPFRFKYKTADHLGYRKCCGPASASYGNKVAHRVWNTFSETKLECCDTGVYEGLPRQIGSCTNSTLNPSKKRRRRSTVDDLLKTGKVRGKTPSVRKRRQIFVHSDL